MENIPIFPKLYKKNNKNSISIWEIHIEQVESNTKYELVWSYGVINGNFVTHRKLVETGKAGRTVCQQAVLEAQSKWNEKRNRESYIESFPQDTEETNAQNIRPMLAVSFRKDLYESTAAATTRAYKVPFPCFVQRKYDGIRAISYAESGGRGVVIQSRKGVVFQNFDILCSQLKPIFDSNPHIVLDGELYTDTIPFEELSGLVRIHGDNASPNAIENIEKIEYHIYDYYDFQQPKQKYQERMTKLEQLLHLCSPESLIKNVKTEIAKNIQEIQSFHDQYVKEGFEGIIIRDKDGIYEPNKRSKYLQKYKEFIDDEFPIVGFSSGVGIEKGLCIWECITHDGKTFSVKPKGTHDYRKKLYENGEQYIGKKLTVVFQEYSELGIPRFPVGKSIRNDI